MKKEISQNIYLFPVVFCVIQFCFQFIAVFNSGYFFANKVLVVSFCIFLFWFLLFLLTIKKHKLFINIQNIIIFIIFILTSFYCIRLIWFSNYLSICAIDDFFKGKTFIDTLYHSTLAQSIVTNGYPSVQQNAPVFLFYHSLAHYFVAYISIILSLPCFITLNYLFPPLIVPLFLFLLQKSVIIVKDYFKKIKQLTITDYFLTAGVVFSFCPRGFLNRIGFVNYSYLLSESCLISIVLMLTYICIIYWGYRKSNSFNWVNLCFLIPLFILGLSFAKISTGFIFCIGICFFIFRNNKLFSFYTLFIFLYLCILGVYYYYSGKFPASYPANDNINSGFSLFHYVKNYTKNPIYGVIHYIYYFLPILIIIFCNQDKRLLRIIRPCNNKTTLFIELILVLAVVGCLPGIILQIDGGSAFYFTIPVNFLIWLLFIGTTTLSSLEEKIGKWKYNGEVFFFRNNDIICKTNLLIFIFVFVLIPMTLNLEAGNKRIYLMMRATVETRINPTHFRKEFNNKIIELFTPAKTIYDKNYIMFKNIIYETINNKKDYCVYISDNTLINRYDYFTRKYKSKTRFLYGNLAISAYLGFPIINSIYKDEEYFYRGDMLKMGTYDEVARYSLPPIICGNRVTKYNMMDAAKKINKKKIIVLENNSYTILDVH